MIPPATFPGEDPGVRRNQRDRDADDRDAAADQREWTADDRDAAADERERTADDRETLADQRERTADDREAGLDALARTLGSDLQERRERVQGALVRSEAKMARTTAAIERAQAAGRRDEASQQRDLTRTRRERDDMAYQVARSLRRTMLDLSVTIRRAQAARSHALLLRRVISDTTETAAVILGDARLARDNREAGQSPIREPAARAH